MAYNCVVLVKQVPDTKAVTGKAMNDDGTVNRAALPAIFNPEDLNALELALQIREQHGGTVAVMTMGPPSAKPPCAQRRTLVSQLEPSSRVMVKMEDGTVTRLDDNIRLETLNEAKTYIANNCEK